ncbi:MAG TPA: alcohol dehydrogenase catalytic domain-containing protein [Candidatus Hydrogenedentes bacterium]|nr:alcohol dehydrogenase catalytic domain-containing protein [Candidatus Hydrogenedentota bacterium]
MIAATYTQNAGYKIQDVPIPVIGDDELLVRVMASSICGTDLRIIQSGQRKLRDGQMVVLGHEFAGVVAQAGPKAADLFPIGMRVGVAPNIGCSRCSMCAKGLFNMCPDYSAFGINMDGAHAEYVRIPHASIQQGSVLPLPPDMPFVHAALIEPLSCVVNGNRSVSIQPGETVLIFGAGPIGLMHAMLARHSGAGTVAVIDTQPDRLDQAARVGIEHLIDPGQCDVAETVMRLTEGRGADVIITACSVPAVQEQSLGLLAPFGRVCFFGGLPKDRPCIRVDANLIHYKNLVVTGVTGGAPCHFRTALGLILDGSVDVSSVVSHTFDMNDMASAFEKALHGQAMKVVIQRQP